jgi:hypothetical protein
MGDEEMQIHAMCMVKNEGDVIEECLRAASEWADHIYVWDNGSDDGTWETVQRLATELEPVVAWRQLATPNFEDGFRREIFMAFADQAHDDDWWVRLDADEFYVDNPRIFLCKLPRRFGIVWYASLSYYMSSVARAQYRQDPELFADDVPTSEKCRYYFSHWSEVRFVRHSVLAPWPSGSAGWPTDLHARSEASPVRILAKHFPYRSPQQIEQRIATRATSALSGQIFSHEAIPNWSEVIDPKSIRQHRWKDIAHTSCADDLERGWESRVVDAASLEFDAHDDRYVVNEELMPRIPGTTASMVSGRLSRTRESIKGQLRNAARLTRRR